MNNKLVRFLGGFSCAALAVFLAGCATPEEHSYNDDYNQHLLTEPKYQVHDDGPSRFKITVDQGRPSPGQERLLDVKQVATIVAETESKRRGWQNWKVDYIYDKDQGWMHVVKVVVTQENAVEARSSQ